MYSVRRHSTGGKPLPSGWHQHWDQQRQIWYYVNTNVIPPQTSYVHPSEVPNQAVRTKLVTTTTGTLSKAQQLYASAKKVDTAVPRTYQQQSPLSPSLHGGNSFPPPPAYHPGISSSLPPSTSTSPPPPSRRYAQPPAPTILPPSNYSTSSLQQQTSIHTGHAANDFYTSAVSQRTPGLGNRAATVGGGRPNASSSTQPLFASGANRRPSMVSNSQVAPRPSRISTSGLHTHRAATTPSETPTFASPTSYQGPHISKPTTTPTYRMTMRPPPMSDSPTAIDSSPAFQPSSILPPPPPPPLTITIPPPLSPLHAGIPSQQTGSSVSHLTGYSFPTQSFPLLNQPAQVIQLSPVPIQMPPPPPLPPIRVSQTYSTGTQVTSPSAAAPAAQNTGGNQNANNPNGSTASSVGKTALRIAGAATLTALTGIPAGAVIGLGAAVSTVVKNKMKNVQQQAQASAGTQSQQAQNQVQAQQPTANQLTHAMAGASLIQPSHGQQQVQFVVGAPVQQPLGHLPQHVQTQVSQMNYQTVQQHIPQQLQAPTSYNYAANAQAPPQVATHQVYQQPQYQASAPQPNQPAQQQQQLPQSQHQMGHLFLGAAEQAVNLYRLQQQDQHVYVAPPPADLVGYTAVPAYDPSALAAGGATYDLSAAASGATYDPSAFDPYAGYDAPVGTAGGFHQSFSGGGDLSVVTSGLDLSSFEM